MSDWAMTPQYNSSDESERAIKWGIEQGDGIANLEVTTVWLDALRTAGFEVVETEDLADTQRYGTVCHSSKSVRCALISYPSSLSHLDSVV